MPQLLDYGKHPDGTQYLVTERINGIRLDQVLDMDCSLPELKRHTVEKPCNACANKAYSSTLELVEGTVLPQLGEMTAQERGILGFVMPPCWLYIDVDPPWKGKGPWRTLRLTEPEYVFQHDRKILA